jgi:hypothetical protein
MPRITIADLPGAANRDDFVLHESRLLPPLPRPPGPPTPVTRPEASSLIRRPRILWGDWNDCWGNAVAGVRG